MQARLYQIDQLRGLAACGIMLFHFVSFRFGELPSESILGRIGIYGVSIFYVISGIALGHVYGETQQKNGFPYRSFFVKRYFRLMPLFILATVATVVLSKKTYPVSDVLLNVTGLFALFDYDGGIATGAWSIGNEWVFYLMLPTLLAMWSHPNRVWRRFLCAMTILCTILFAFAPATSLASYWNIYIHPLNQCVFFIAGSAFGYFKWHQRLIDWKTPLIGAAALVCFMFLPITGDRIGLVTGTNRLILTSSVLLIALAWYRMNIRFWSPLENLLVKLGDWSYSIYMLHPLVWILLVGGLKWIGWQWNEYAVIAAACVICLFASMISYNWFERPSMQLAQRFIKGKINHS
jgi:exopolysaccharide production protein ExoZ